MKVAIFALAVLALAQPQLALAQTETPSPAPASATFTADQLEQIVAPIALHPDALLTQILMASTYPLEIVEAQRWVEKNPGLKEQSARGGAQGAGVGSEREVGLRLPDGA